MTDRLPARPVIRDDFDAPVAPGAVVGSRSACGALREGVDRERTMAADNGALRIAFLEEPGWGREALAYRRFTRTPGLAMAALVLNGHNASRIHVPEPQGRLAWAIARMRAVVRPRPQPEELPENLAVGWDDNGDHEGRPGGPCFTMRGALEENGTLCARVAGNTAELVQAVRNLPILYVVALRDRGAVYYAASLPTTPGFAEYPLLRPLAVDAGGAEPELWPTVHQAVLGEVGWRHDTRVYGMRVAECTELFPWFGTAHVADDLTGRGPLAGSSAEAGGDWTAEEDGWLRSEAGARGGGHARLPCAEPSGLVHVELSGPVDGFALHLRGDGRGGGVAVVLDGGTARLVASDGRDGEVLARDDALDRTSGERLSLQVVDDGAELLVLADGRAAFGGPVRNARLVAGTAVGFDAPLGSGVTVSRFEAHPRASELPDALRLGAPWDARGHAERFTDSFDGPAGSLGAPWARRFGQGELAPTGRGAARVVADREHPNPGRTIFTVPWDEPAFAEAEIEQTPPGSGRGQDEKGRCGLAFVQGPDDYLVVSTWLDDHFGGTSVSSFLRLGGHEDHFRAVWTNIGREITWGVRSTLAVAFDGMSWTARVDGRPVLHRALTDVHPGAPRLRIAEVGIVVNWEYGDDTGTLIHRFAALGQDAR